MVTTPGVNLTTVEKNKCSRTEKKLHYTRNKTKLLNQISTINYCSDVHKYFCKCFHKTVIQLEVITIVALPIAAFGNVAFSILAYLHFLGNSKTNLTYKVDNMINALSFLSTWRNTMLYFKERKATSGSVSCRQPVKIICQCFRNMA